MWQVAFVICDVICHHFNITVFLLLYYVTTYEQIVKQKLVFAGHVLRGSSGTNALVVLHCVSENKT